jgi:hypothetical protein
MLPLLLLPLALALPQLVTQRAPLPTRRLQALSGLCIGPASRDDGAPLVALPCSDERADTALRPRADGYGISFGWTRSVIAAEEGTPAAGSTPRFWTPGDDGPLGMNWIRAERSPGGVKIAYADMCLSVGGVGEPVVWMPCTGDEEGSLSQTFVVDVSIGP